MSLEPAPTDGVLPQSFYATTHLPTQVRVNGTWIDVEAVEMDLAICVRKDPLSARMIPMAEAKKGDLIVTGRDGVRVFPLERPQERDVFGFMDAQVSSERPYRHIMSDVAKRMDAIKQLVRTIWQPFQKSSPSWGTGHCAFWRQRGVSLAY